MREIPRQYTQPEQKLFQAMFKLGLNFFSQQPIKVSEDRGYVADFLFPAVKVVIEVDGSYWHDRTNMQRIKTRAKTEDLEAMGYTVLRFTDVEVRKDAETVALKVYAVVKQKWAELPRHDFQFRPFRREEP